MLARTTAREREMAVRLAIGAGRWRLIRLVLGESLLLSIAGAIAGAALARALSRGLVAYLNTEDNPDLSQLQVGLAALCLPARNLAADMHALRLGCGAAGFPYASGFGHEIRRPRHDGKPRTPGLSRRARSSRRSLSRSCSCSLPCCSLRVCGTCWWTTLDFNPAAYSSRDWISARLQIPSSNAEHSSVSCSIAYAPSPAWMRQPTPTSCRSAVRAGATRSGWTAMTQPSGKGRTSAASAQIISKPCGFHSPPDAISMTATPSSPHMWPSSTKHSPKSSAWARTRSERASGAKPLRQSPKSST